MNYEEQLKIQAYLDGELAVAESKQIEALLVGDTEAQALLSELKSTRQIFKDAEAEYRVPESREFYWSKIQRQIESEAAAPARTERPASWLAAWRRFMAPIGALAAVLIVTLFTLSGNHNPAAGPDVETSLADPGAFTYRDYDAGATLVWLSYPAENEVAQSDTAGTVQ